MDYKEKYEALLANIKAYHARFGPTCNLKKELEECVPELRESEDERIRKEMIDYFYGCIQRNKKSGFRVEQIKSWISYLERQNAPLTPEEKMNHPLYLEGFDVGKKVGEVLKGPKPTPDWMPKFLDELRSKKNYFDWEEHRDIEGQILAIINWIDPNYFKRKEKRQPVEWSEEDENRFKNLLYLVERSGEGKATIQGFTNFINRLKSLRPLTDSEGYIKCAEEYESLPKIHGWVTRDSKEYDDGFIAIYPYNKPTRNETKDCWQDDLNTRISIPLWKGMFPEITWESEPVEVELLIRKV